MCETLHLFNDSFDRCISQSDFLDRFYDRLLDSSDEIAAKFRHTEFNKQKAALKMALYVLLFAYKWDLEGDAYLRGLARRHSRHDLDVRPEMYDLWLDCLLATARECDPLFDEAIEDSWRTVLRPGIEFMKSQY